MPKKTVEVSDVDKTLGAISNPPDVETMQKESIPPTLLSSKSNALLEEEISNGYREFDYNGRVGRIWQPAVGDDGESSLAYAQAYNAFLLSTNMATEEQLRVEYESRGMWSKEKDDMMDSLIDDMDAIDEQITNLNQKPKKSKKTKEAIVQLLKDKREKMAEHDILRGQKQSLFSTSVEARALEVAIRAKLCCCVKDLEGNRIWEDLEALDQERDRDFLNVVLQKAIFFWGGLPDPFYESSQEAESGNTE